MPMLYKRAKNGYNTYISANLRICLQVVPKGGNKEQDGQ